MKTIVRKFNRVLSKPPDEFEFDIENHRNYLNNFLEPKNDFQRSFFQYKCLNFQRTYLARFINNAIATIVFVPFIFYLFIKYKKKRIEPSRKNIAVIISSGIIDIIPENLLKQFKIVKTVVFANEYYLKKADFKFIALFIHEYFFSPFFLLKCITKIAMYRSIIDQFNPNTIICSSEYSFTSSLLTAYCELNDINHINVMHGDKFLNIREAFFHFHKCYVWDKHFIELFIELRAEPNQFIISKPPSLMLNDDSLNTIYEFTYYLGDEPEREMTNIKKSLLTVNIKPSKICIRFHPRYTDVKKASIIFNEFTIEYPHNTSLIKSFALTKRIVSLYSTVLFQGYTMGKEVIIDDLTSNKKYKKLKELQYIMISKPHIKLSSFIQDNCNL